MIYVNRNVAEQDKINGLRLVPPLGKIWHGAPRQWVNVLFSFLQVGNGRTKMIDRALARLGWQAKLV